MGVEGRRDVVPHWSQGLTAGVQFKEGELMTHFVLFLFFAHE